MYVTSESDKCKDVAERWNHRYYNSSTNEWDAVWPFSDEKKGKTKVSAEIIYNNLIALKGEGTSREIEKIIGNSSWTDVSCDECDRNVDVAVAIGEEENYDTRTAMVCLGCLNKAVELAKKKRARNLYHG